MQRAKDEVFQMEETEELATDMEDAPLEMDEAKQHFIQEVTKSGFTETLAQAAFQHVEDHTDIDAGLFVLIFVR